MANVLTTSQLPNAIDRRVRKHFLDTYPTVEPMLDKVFSIDKQEDETEYEQDYQGLGQYESTAEATTYAADNFGEGYQTTYTPTKYTKKVPITYEARKWDKSALTTAGNVGSEMAKAAADTIEETAASVFNNGFDTSHTSYGDSKPLFSVDHDRPDGGSAGSNASGDSVPFGDEALEDAYVDFRDQRNKRGRLVRTQPKILLGPPALEGEMRRVTASQQRADTGDNDINVNTMREYYGGSVKVLIWEYLSEASGGSDTAWFILDPDLCKITWKWADKPQVTRDDTTGIQADILYFLGMYYASYGWSDYVGSYRSQGDMSEYTD